MNDRIFEALTTAGLSTSPLSTLDHPSPQAGTFFALYNDELVYHEAGRSSRVPLRDVTRIHSDREGLLRVETSERTAVTASLLGYDPGRVQAFFQQVRDVTARAKELPVIPLHQAPTKLEPALRTVTGSSIPSSGLAGNGLAGTGPSGMTLSGTAPSGTAPSGMTQSGMAGSASGLGSDAGVSGAAMPGISAYTPAAPVTPAAGAAPVSPARAAASEPSRTPPAQPFGGLPATDPQLPRPEPVVISSMPPVSSSPPFQERAGDRVRQTARPAPVAEPLPVAPTGAAQAHTPGVLVSGPERSDSPDEQTSGGLDDELLRRADTVHSLARTVGTLAIVLGLAGLALAYFQWQAGSRLVAIWTLLAGGVGAVALLAFAEALRLLSALARRSRQE